MKKCFIYISVLYQLLYCDGFDQSSNVGVFSDCCSVWGITEHRCVVIYVVQGDCHCACTRKTVGRSRFPCHNLNAAFIRFING